MAVQMTIRVQDELAAFVDEAARAGEGSRADIINRALRRELRRRAARSDAAIYARTEDQDLDGGVWAEVSQRQAAAAWTDLE